MLTLTHEDETGFKREDCRDSAKVLLGDGEIFERTRNAESSLDMEPGPWSWWAGSLSFGFFENFWCFFLGRNFFFLGNTAFIFMFFMFLELGKLCTFEKIWLFGFRTFLLDMCLFLYVWFFCFQ